MIEITRHSKISIVSVGELHHLRESLESCNWIIETKAESGLWENTIQVNMELLLFIQTVQDSALCISRSFCNMLLHEVRMG